MRPRRRDRTNKSVVKELADLIAQIPGVQLILKVDSGIGARDWSIHAMLDPSQLGWAALKNLTSALRDPSRADGHVGLGLGGGDDSGPGTLLPEKLHPINSSIANHVTEYLHT